MGSVGPDLLLWSVETWLDHFMVTAGYRELPVTLKLIEIRQNHNETESLGNAASRPRGSRFFYFYERTIAQNDQASKGKVWGHLMPERINGTQGTRLSEYC